jgi:hypothetical protein
MSVNAKVRGGRVNGCDVAAHDHLGLRDGNGALPMLSVHGPKQMKAAVVSDHERIELLVRVLNLRRDADNPRPRSRRVSSSTVFPIPGSPRMTRTALAAARHPQKRLNTLALGEPAAEHRRGVGTPASSPSMFAQSPANLDLPSSHRDARLAPDALCCVRVQRPWV